MSFVVVIRQRGVSAGCRRLAHRFFIHAHQVGAQRLVGEALDVFPAVGNHALAQRFVAKHALHSLSHALCVVGVDIYRSLSAGLLKTRAGAAYRRHAAGERLEQRNAEALDA